MPSETRHFQEEMQELLDERLTAEARAEVERHLESCQECRREFEALRWTRQFSQRQFAAEAAPPKLEQNILAALDLEDRGSNAEQASPPRWWRQRRAILAYASVLLTIAALTLSYFILRAPPRNSPPLPSAVARDYRNYQAEKLPLMLRTEKVEEMERFFSSEGIAFETRIFDLDMMNYRLEGGRVHQLDNRPSALFVYRGKNNQVLLCQMVPGQAAELAAAGAAVRENNGIRFYIHRLDGLTLAFWQEGAVTCVLASDIDPEEVVQLAFAKAMKI